MRKPFIAGNWKLNKNIAETKELATSLKEKLKDVKDVEIAVCPIFTSIPTAVEVLKGTNIGVGGQNLYWEKDGAFTGEVSGPMLKEAGCKYVIIGHSERRQYFGETNQTVNKRIFAAFAADLIPIVCIGEVLAEREADKTLTVLEKQLEEGLKGLTKEHKDIVIAYEPVWAIGTGKTATPEQAQEAHAFVRKILGELLGADIAKGIRIQYGGSVKPENVTEIMAQPDVDGALVGGASLKADSFEKLVKYK
ncbi:MAG: triose-phosphate isomerase [Candidatus Margulisbacteria bacterium]|nr:triose-phosphate isomerase [Candidatus Margulisiibacteriota bacterium]